MSMKQTLTAAMVCAFALSFNAFAKVAYDKEYTNKWFKVTAAEADLNDTSKWTKPSKGGEVTQDATRIKLDTDLDDPLVYKAASQSDDLAIVTARFEATANTAAPTLVDGSPQAALTVIVNGADTNWYGLVKGSSGNEWVKFTNMIPTVGEEYDIQIEFDLRSDAATKRIRYSVGGTVLVGAGSTDGWYGNPQSTATAIQFVSFAGTGDIGDFRGDNVGKVTPVASVTGTSQTDGFDYTNGTLNVTLSSAAAGTATLKVIDFATGAVKAEYTAKGVASGVNNISWQIADGQIGSLVAGGTYGYAVTITPGSTDKTHESVTKTGTFVAANSTNSVNWFWADATSGQRNEHGGSWEDGKIPEIVENAYEIDDSKFVVTDASKGSNNLTRVDASVTFETMVDGSTLEPVDGAFGGFVAASTDAGNAWMALTVGTPKSQWVALQGDIAPVVNTPYVIRAEVSFIQGNKRVRYLVKEDGDDTDFCVLSHDGLQWLDLADDSKISLTAVEMQGSGKLAKLEANITDKALFEVNNKRFDTMEAALEEAGTNGEYAITLLTNATIDPTEEGKYEIVAGNHQYVSGGKVSSGDKTIVVDEYGDPLVRPSEAVMKAVTAPGGAKYKDTDSLRAFLERNQVTEYTDGDADSNAIQEALAKPAENGLTYWQDYALGIDKETPVAPVTTPAGDTDAANITLAIPAIDTSKYSPDYDISYRVMKGSDVIQPEAGNDKDPGAILIPLTNGTGTYTIKVLFTPVP